MPTVGNTAKPANTQEWFGLNSVNIMATLITMPAGGPWRITELGAWIAGVGSSAEVRLCAWTPGGVLLAYSNPFTVGGYPFALGNSEQWAAFVTVDINGGDSIYVGWWRNPAHSVQNGRFSGGSHLHEAGGGSIVNLSGNNVDGSGGLGAYVNNYQALNTAPDIPVITTSGVQHNGRTVFYSWTYSDPEGNPQASAHWQLWNVAESALLDERSGYAETSLWRTLPAGYNANQEYKYRVRNYDGSLWGAWSAMATFRPNTPPNAPTLNSVPTNTLTPTFTGGIVDPDGNTLTAREVQVARSSDSVTMWGPGNPGGGNVASGGQFSNVYAGTPLAYGTQYLVRYRFQDQWGAWGPWSGWTYWTPVNPVAGAPSLSPNTTATKQNTNTPNLTVSHGSAFTDYEIEIHTPSGPLVQAISPAPFTAATSKIAVPAALNWGQEYHYRARVLIGGVWSLWSGWHAFKINAEPTAPTLSMPQALISPSGERIVTTLTPILKAVFNDADKVPYGDAPTAASLEVRNNATDALIATLTGTAEEVTYSGAALAYDTVYKWRKRYTDNAGRQGPFSNYMTFKPTQAPTAGLTSPANASTITDSTPTLDWTFTGSAGKVQYSYRVEVTDLGPTGANYAEPIPAYDSGERVSSESSHVLPHGAVLDDHDYSWKVTVKDTDGLSYVLT